MSSTRPDLKFSDNADERSYYRRFAALPPADSGTVRVIDHNNGDYFSVLDQDADLIAEHIYKTTAVVKYSNGHRHVTILPQVFTNNVLRFCLVDRPSKVEVYTTKFEVICVATPGNLEALSTAYLADLEAMSSDASAPVVCAVKVQASAGAKTVGLCVADLLTSSLVVAEFADNDVFLNLESVLLQLGVKELVVPSLYDPQDEASETAKLFQVVHKVGTIVVSSVSSSVFSAANIDQDLGKIVSCKEDTTIELVLAAKGILTVENALLLACCLALISYLGLLADSGAGFSIEKHNLASFMKMDASTARALNIFPSNGPMGKLSNVTSVFELLNRCKTAAGSRLLSQWLKQPLTSAAAISDRHALVGHLVDDTALRVFLGSDWLAQVPDFKRLLKKISSGLKKADTKKLDDVVRLYQLVLVLPGLVDRLKATEEDLVTENPSVSALIRSCWREQVEKALGTLVKFQELVETTVDLLPLLGSAHDALHADFNIKPEFDLSLVTLNDQIQAVLTDIRAAHEAAGEDLGIDTDKKLKLEHHQNHGWCFRVTRTDSAVLRNTSYIELQTVKAGVFFTTSHLRKLASDHRDLAAAYNAKQAELVAEILAITATYQLVFLRLSHTLAHMDVLVSFANTAIFAPVPYVKPVLHPLSLAKDAPETAQRQVKLSAARHPVLEVQDDVNFIANDVNMAHTNGGHPFSIITGPNMGGKSTYIRQVGVVALMSQVGLFVPALGDMGPPEVAVFDAILSRVGAGDSQLKGLSTFMIEMLETSSILATATHNSLVIIDELGRGTSTYDGFGLAWAILDHLIAHHGCFTLFATHFHELTQLAEKHPGKVANLHVVAHVDKKTAGDDDITLMYKVEPGISDKSFGIHVAELVKFPAKIVSMAKRKAAELQGANDDLPDTKRSKCSRAEIDKGITTLKTILGEWKAQCYDENTGKCTVDSTAAVAALKGLLDKDHSEAVKNDAFIREVLAEL